jgi:hypothetical protein
MQQVCRVAQPAVAPCPVVGRFDAELYLRLQGEEVLLAREHRSPWDTPLVKSASALVAVGAISATKAEEVIDDYALAEALRTEQGLEYRGSFGPARRRRKRKIKPLEPRRVVPCDDVIEDAQGTLEIRRVALAEHFTTIAVTWRPNATQGRPRRRGRMTLGGGPVSPPHPTVVDDQGTRSGTAFSGGGSELEWEGRLTTHRPLARDTAWIELDGTRVELAAHPAEWSVSVDELPEQPAAHAYLWRRLAIRNDVHELESLDPAIEALLAAGALEPDDPVIDEVRTVWEALQGHPRMQSNGRARRQVPQPWRSLLSRQGREDGPEGTIALSAVTPEFDGFSVAVSSVESRPDGFQVEVEVTPGTEVREHFDWRVPPPRLAWWAEDDRGNHYLGHIQSWGGGEDHDSCDLQFRPPLHPRASKLRIMPTGEKSRAVITVPLPWHKQQSASGETST